MMENSSKWYGAWSGKQPFYHPFLSTRLPLAKKSVSGLSARNGGGGLAGYENPGFATTPSIQPANGGMQILW
jgi:hypothetical protein